MTMYQQRSLFVRRRRCVLVFLAGCLPLTAWAQVVPGASTSFSASWCTPERWPDVAYDPDDQVFLAISGATNVLGQFLAHDGTALGAPFQVNQSTYYAQAPRVAYSSAAGAFLVAWHASISSSATQVYGRFVSYAAPGAASEFPISTPGTDWEMGAAVAASPGSGEFLVAWKDPSQNIEAQQVGPHGVLLGGPIAVSDTTRYHRDPAVGFDPINNQFAVAYAGCEGTNDCFLEVQRIQPGTGAIVATPSSLDVHQNATYIPELAFRASSGSWLVTWYRATATGASIEARTLHADGTVDPNTIQVTDTASYDANSLAYDATADAFLFVGHSAAAQDLAIELDVSGAPLGTTLWAPAQSNGNFNPRIAASTDAPSWMAITSTEFSALTAQEFTAMAAVRDAGGPDFDAGSVETDAGAQMVDAGPPESDAGLQPVDAGGAALDAGSMAVDAGASTNDAAPPDAGPTRRRVTALGGCSSTEGLSWFGLLFALGLGAARGSRRARGNPYLGLSRRRRNPTLKKFGAERQSPTAISRG